MCISITRRLTRSGAAYRDPPPPEPVGVGPQNEQSKLPLDVSNHRACGSIEASSGAPIRAARFGRSPAQRSYPDSLRMPLLRRVRIATVTIVISVICTVFIATFAMTIGVTILPHIIIAQGPGSMSLVTV